MLEEYPDILTPRDVMEILSISKKAQLFMLTGLKVVDLSGFIPTRYPQVYPQRELKNPC